MNLCTWNLAKSNRKVSKTHQDWMNLPGKLTKVFSRISLIQLSILNVMDYIISSESLEPVVSEDIEQAETPEERANREKEEKEMAKYPR